ncbi:carbohydrate esterase [Chaetomidium leptoderma]|uniref:Carbohydrate esterase n=1 Tax=Chaetomidium leptoderma TaxID=669021 RepID=A0AAN6VTS4_9PEZI|nr:carbohydrate esterase [Chaetomidium leptoderma]
MTQFNKALSIAAVALASLAAARVAAPETESTSLAPRFLETKYLFIFGDSYTATGFNPSGTKPSSSNPIGNPALPGSTFSGGYDWPGYLVTAFNTSQTLLYNFAVGGATIDSNLVAPPGNGIPSFVEQMGQWENSVGSKPSYAPWTSDNTLAGAFFGINDILGKFWDNQDPPVSQMVDRFIGQFQTLYASGVRNFFFVTVPPLDKTPLIAGQSAAGRTRVMTNVNNFNTQLAARLASFESQNSGAKTAVVTSADPFNTAISNPGVYGAADATCEDKKGERCLWWDNLHPATAIHKLLAEAVASAFEGTFF